MKANVAPRLIAFNGLVCRNDIVIGIHDEVTPSAEVCEECLQIGSSWVQLRICLTCGHVGCCDFTEPTRKEALSRQRTPDHPVVRTGGGLALVLCA